MAEGLNRVMLLGNIGADPELRTTQNGTAILKIRLATTERYLDANKAWQERTEWHTCIVWGKRGESLSRFLTKGSNIFVEGSLRTSSYEDKEGVKRYKTEIVASNVLLTGGKRDGGGRDDAAPPRHRAEPRGFEPSTTRDELDEYGKDEPLPFLPHRLGGDGKQSRRTRCLR